MQFSSNPINLTYLARTTYFHPVSKYFFLETVDQQDGKKRNRVSNVVSFVSGPSDSNQTSQKGT